MAKRRRAGQLWVFAIVAALHIAVCWVLLIAPPPFKVRTTSSNLELLYLTPDVRVVAARRPAAARRFQPLTQQRGPTEPLNQPRSQGKPSTAPGEEDNAIHPPINWTDELKRAASASASAAAEPKPREFGEPHIAPTPPASPPEFGWSYSRTHRVETGPGGVAVHLGDHCVIAFTPFPFPVCGLGKRDANGDLFKHMRDPPPTRDGKDSP